MCGASGEQVRALGMRLNRSQGFRPKRLTGIAVGVRKCARCELIFADPQPIPDNFEDHYGDADEYWRDEYFAEDPTYFKREIAAAKPLLPARDKQKALDIGAGIGKAMQALTAAGFDAWGMEPSAPFRDIAIKRGLDPERLVLGGIEDASYPPETFDFVTFGAVLEHLPDPAAALTRALAWLKPGGIIQVEVPSSRHLIARLTNLYFRLRGTNYVTNISPMHAPYHFYEFGLRSFELHGQRCGYEVAHHVYGVGEILHFPRIMHAPLRWYMERTRTGMQLTVYLRKRDTMHRHLQDRAGA
jgi:SAM-dependent methyltransferase